MNTKQKILTILALIVFSAMPSAKAWIGETRDQVIRDAQRDGDTTKIVNWNSATVVVLYRDGSDINHVFGSNGREIAFILFSAKRLSAGEVFRIQRTYRTTWEATGIRDGMATWKSRSGLLMGTIRLEKYDKVSILDSNKLDEIEQRTPHPARPKETATYPPPQQPYVVPIAPVVTPQAMPTPMTPSNSQVVAGRTPNDCYVIASQIYARLKTSTYWVKVAGLMIKEKSTNEVAGHAVVFSQLTPSSNVVMSDENGGLDLQTKSHDLQEITDAAAQISSHSPKVPYIVQSARWIDEASPPVVATSHRSSISSVTADDPAYRVGYLLGYFAAIAILFAGYISLIVICFLKGKGGMAVLGIFGFFVPFLWWATLIGAIRIAKPSSWWARKKYGPEKMDIAHRRFTPVYNEAQKATPVIIDDPVERALERVRTNQLITT